MELKLEQLSVHSRDLACRYVVVKAGETLSYSIKPQRNSIFYGIYRQAKGRKPDLAGNRMSKSNLTLPASLSFEERLKQAQLEPVVERKKLVGGKVFKGSLAVEHEGMYALVFDNTFSKQKSKLVTFILQIHPCDETPTKSTQDLVDDEDVVPQVIEDNLTGALMKRRRKRLQGWARRWFVLDFESNTLNYYFNQNSTVLRGAIPLKIAVFSANKENLEINIDSGAEVWNLKAQSEGSFVMWCQALAQAGDSKHDGRTHLAPRFVQKPADLSSISDKPAIETSQKQIWSRLWTVYSQLDEVHATFRDTILKESSSLVEISEERQKRQTSPSRSGNQDNLRPDSVHSTTPRKNAWYRKRPSELSQIAPSTEELFKQAKADTHRRGTLFSLEEQMGQGLRTFEAILKEQDLISRSGASKKQVVNLLDDEARRSSMDSIRTVDEVWVDAMSDMEEKGFLVAHHDSDSESHELEEDDEDDAGMHNDDSSDADSFSEYPRPMEKEKMLFSSISSDPAIDFNLALSPLDGLTGVKVQRRHGVPAILDQPPSALKLMTSKVGSDVSSMSAPAATNEPLGVLQRAAEELEYSNLLDAAGLATQEDGRRLLLLAVFAISSLSSMRHKERAKRKPFNPMLGETFELVREDKQFRFISEKVQHRPLVGVASHAESHQWVYHQYQATSQKFYGKSMLLTTEGITTVMLRTGDVFIWEKPEMYLKNITWGEKFIEPSGEMVIKNTTTGEVRVPAKRSARSR